MNLSKSLESSVGQQVREMQTRITTSRKSPTAQRLQSSEPPRLLCWHQLSVVSMNSGTIVFGVLKELLHFILFFLVYFSLLLFGIGFTGIYSYSVILVREILL